MAASSPSSSETRQTTLQSSSKPSSENIHYSSGKVTHVERAKYLQMKGCTIWLTGLSASGKSTIAMELESQLVQAGIAAYRLDGDNLRFGLNADLRFSPEDRAENIRRVGEVSKLFADAGIVTISSFISPYKKDRDQVRRIHDESNLPFIEVFVDAPLSVVEQRDPKGLYEKARQGLIKGFTGIDDPYEQPERPELHLKTHELSIVASTSQILDYLKQIDII